MSAHHSPEVDMKYNSCMRAAGHIFSAYCSISAAKRSEDGFMLTGNEGMPHNFCTIMQRKIIYKAQDIYF